MLMRRVIPCLDVHDGRVVKGMRFRSLRDAGEPAALAARYDTDGADEVLLLDVSATARNRGHRIETVREVRSVLSIPLTVGGGIRSISDASALLEAGADKVAVNSAALADPALLTRLATRFGSQCITVSIDASRAVADRWRVYSRAGTSATDRDARSWAVESVERGAGEILLTSIDRDGMREGFDLQLVRAVAPAVRVPTIASGGANNADDLIDAFDAGADAVLAASILHDGVITVGELKRTMLAAGARVRR